MALYVHVYDVVCVCLRVCTYFASCFHREKKSVEFISVSSINLLMKTGNLSINWWALPPTLRERERERESRGKREREREREWWGGGEKGNNRNRFQCERHMDTATYGLEGEPFKNQLWGFHGENYHGFLATAKEACPKYSIKETMPWKVFLWNFPKHTVYCISYVPEL